MSWCWMRVWANLLPITAPCSSSRGIVRGFSGATLVLAQTRAVSNPSSVLIRKYATAEKAAELASTKICSCRSVEEEKKSE